MKIYGGPTFNPAKVVLVAEELGIDYEYITVDLSKGENKTEDYLKIHPLGKIPAMEHNGNAFYESNSMCRYLSNISDAKLYSKDPVKAAHIDQMADFLSMHIGRWIGVYYVQELIVRDAMKGQIDQAALDEATTFLNQQLPFIDQILAKNKFICGDDITLADCIGFALFMCREYTSFSFENCANINRWYDEMRSRPSYKNMIGHIKKYGF